MHALRRLLDLPLPMRRTAKESSSTTSTPAPRPNGGVPYTVRGMGAIPGLEGHFVLCCGRRPASSVHASAPQSRRHVKEPALTSALRSNGTRSDPRGRKRVLLTLATGTGKTSSSSGHLEVDRWSVAGREPPPSHPLPGGSQPHIPMEPTNQQGVPPGFRRGNIGRFRASSRPAGEVYFALYKALADTGDS